MLELFVTSLASKKQNIKIARGTYMNTTCHLSATVLSTGASFKFESMFLILHFLIN